MGSLRMGPPGQLVETLREACGIRCFVETGTYQGATARWAAARFEKVVTIEASRSWYDRTGPALRALPNVEPLLGDTRVELAGVVSRLRDPALFWLDAHWSGGDTFGSEEECPVLAELAAVLRAPVEHLVLIDDARLFLAPPPRPHRRELWPDIRELIQALAPRPDAYVAVFEDVIAIVPPGARPIVVQYCQEAAEAAAGRGRGQAGLAGRLHRSGGLLFEALRTLVRG